MKSIISTLLLTTILFSFTKAQSVTTTNIKWNSQSTLKADDGQQIEEVTEVITYGTASIVWRDVNGSQRKNFQIIEAIGEWPNITQPGWVQYEVTDGTFSGTISIRKSETETKIFIAVDSEVPQSYVLAIDGHVIL